jgi:hypothetical protein
MLDSMNLDVKSSLSCHIRPPVVTALPFDHEYLPFQQLHDTCESKTKTVEVK